MPTVVRLRTAGATIVSGFSWHQLVRHARPRLGPTAAQERMAAFSLPRPKTVCATLARTRSS